MSLNEMLDRVNKLFGFKKYAIRDTRDVDGLLYLDEYNIVGEVIKYSLLQTQESIHYYIVGMYRIVLFVEGV